MKIREIEFKPLKAELKAPFRTSLREVKSIDNLLIKVYLEDGTVGYSEAPETAVITGDTLDSIKTAIKKYIEPSIKGLDIFNTEDIFYNINHSIINNSTAKAAVDIAIYDLLAKKSNMPLYKYLGGRLKPIYSDLTISLNNYDTMLKDSVKAVEDGFKTLKIKVGHGYKEDTRIIRNLYKELGNKVQFIIDANQAWEVSEALYVCKRIEDLDIALIEQPVYYKNIDGLEYITKNTSLNIMADESVFNFTQAAELIRKRACDVINIKLMKAGGINQALKIVTLAEEYGIDLMMGCMLESSVSIIAAIHLAMSRRNFKYFDVDGMFLVKNLPVDIGANIEKDKILLTDKIGLGVSEI